jgi:hypothetical protein
MPGKTYIIFLIFLAFPALRAQQPAATFIDEFDGPRLDLARWVPHDPYSRSSNDFQLSGGQLHIGPGAALSTFGLFSQTYGHFEVRFKAPAAKGLRARFRLMPIPLAQLPAIDVVETSGRASTTIFFANRWGTEQTERSFGDSFTVADLSADFHTITLDWNRERLQWSVDGKEKFRCVDGVPHVPMFLVLDLLGTEPADQTFDVKYVRVSK